MGGLCPCGAPRVNKTYCLECQRARARDSLYGKGAGEWAANLEVLQEGRCSICGETPNESLQLDHDHETGAWRGLLCRRCNSLVGFIDKHSRLLPAVQAYLGE